MSYTFGQPVRGNLSITIDNTKSRKCQTRITRNITISGCTDVEETAAKLQIVDCNVYSLKVNAVVTEEGTGVEAMASTTTSIQRRLITFKTLYKDQYMKPNLPFTLKSLTSVSVLSCAITSLSPAHSTLLPTRLSLSKISSVPYQNNPSGKASHCVLIGIQEY
ncbi:hypothetical protein Pmani_010092 [Petrolisthes manimaculis]|uniref:Uncharacterized protein n=1 Tax=Petrolisthes manimaculis TaxID=1843537 RepID=A0AAE1UD27_9EUCA|nr:hypothetical protein Pmani_010092 [Petrolisthes manimaculis]